MSTFPKFNKGKAWEEFTVAEWKHLTEQVERVAGLTVQPPLRLIGTHNTMAITLDPSAFQTLPRDETVVMPSAPPENAQTLTVYRVRYKTQPPRACITEADQERGCGVVLEVDPIVAYPDFGYKAVDYAPYASSGINDETTYLKARYRDGVWIVAVPGEGDGGGQAFCKIVDPASVPVEPPDPPLVIALEASAVAVQFVTADGVSKGDPQAVFTWPARTYEHYKMFVGKPDVFLALYMEGGWYVRWDMRFMPVPVPENIETGDCSA